MRCPAFWDLPGKEGKKRYWLLPAKGTTPQKSRCSTRRSLHGCVIQGGVPFWSLLRRPVKWAAAARMWFFCDRSHLLPNPPDPYLALFLG